MTHLTKEMVRRVARQAEPGIGPITPEENEALLKEEEELRKKLIQEAQLVVAKNLWEKLRKAFTPKGLPFFRLYVKMKAFELGAEPMPDASAFKAMFKRAVVKLNSITSPIDKRPLSSLIVNMVAMARPTIESLLVRLSGAPDNDRLWKELAKTYSNLFIEVAKDKQVYIRALMRGKGPRKWAYLRKMSPKQEWVEKLKDNDPESYAITQETGETLRKINDRIARRIQRNPDVELKRAYLMGKPVLMSVHPRTGEEVVYDIDGSILPVEDWKEKRKEKLKAQKKLRDLDMPEPFEGMREIPDWVVDNLPGEVEWVSLSDDQAKSGRLTRIYQTKTFYDFQEFDEQGRKEAKGYKVIVDGKFKGRLLDDMVNAQGRLLEGTEYEYNPKTERSETVQLALTPVERTKQALIQWSERCDMLRERLADEDPPEDALARKRWDARNARLGKDCELIDTMMLQTTPATASQKKKWKRARSFLGRQLKQYDIEREERPIIKRDPSTEEPYITSSNVKIRRGSKVLKKKMLYIGLGPGGENEELKNIMRALAVNAAPASDRIDKKTGKPVVKRTPRILAIAGSVSTVRRFSGRNEIDKTEQLLEILLQETPRREEMITRARKYIRLREELSWRDKAVSATQKQQRTTWSKILKKEFKIHGITGEKTREGFWFDPKDFATIREALGGMSLSAGALKMVEQHFKDLAAAEQATVREDPSYLMENIGGFKAEHLRMAKDEDGNQIYVAKNDKGHWADVPEGTPGSKPKVFDMLIKQQQSLAWLDANGGQGVCALETGIGKTLIGIGMMQRLKRDGMLEPGASYSDEKGHEVELNGRFLWVCPKSLKGNVGEEMKNWLTKEGATDLDNRVDVMAYEQFRTAMGKMTYPAKSATHTGFWEGRKWEPKRYVACFFDEAHVLAKDPSTKLSRAAQKLVHPRKIMLTASPMKNEPMQAYILSAIASNKPLRGRGSQENRLEMRRFKKRYVETVGGRALGVKSDPEVVRELQTWVKRNIFHADKEKVVEYILPQLDTDTQPIEMPQEAEQVYRDITKTFAATMRGLVGKFRDLKVDKDTKDERVEKAFGQKFKPVVKLLTNMANDPGRAFIEMAEMIERGGVFNSKGELVPIPEPISKLVQGWVKKLGGPAGVRQMIQNTTHEVVDANGDITTVKTYIPGPKIESATETVKNRIDETDSRSILFSDDPELCMSTGQHMAKTVSGKHVVGLKDTIHLFSGGKELKELVIPLPTAVIDALVKDPEERKEWYKQKVVTHKLPFKKRAMKMYPGIPAEKKKGLNQHAESDKWQVWVLKHIVSVDPAFRTATLYGQAYSEGHNLQSFDTVIHLDRDTWNNEHMKQRTARAWRQGQKNQVKEVTLDATYSSHDDRGRRLSQQDETLDQIRDHFSKVEGKLFDAIIKESQGTVLGKEWLEMEKRDASTLRLDDKHMDLMLSPYSDRSKTRGEA